MITITLTITQQPKGGALMESSHVGSHVTSDELKMLKKECDNDFKQALVMLKGTLNDCGTHASKTYHVA